MGGEGGRRIKGKERNGYPDLRCDILGVTSAGWHLEAAGAAGTGRAQLQHKPRQLLSASGLFPAPIHRTVLVAAQGWVRTGERVREPSPQRW